MKNHDNNSVNPAFLKYPLYGIINIVDIFLIYQYFQPVIFGLIIVAAAAAAWLIKAGYKS